MQNASLAVSLAAAWETRAGQHLPAHQHAAAARLQQLGRGVLPDTYVHGVQSCEWPGRSHVRPFCAMRFSVAVCVTVTFERL